LDIHFRVVNAVSKKYTGSGYGRDLTPAVAAIGGYFLKSDEQNHGDLWSNIKYDSWLAKIGEFPIKSVDVKFTWTGSVQKANIIQMPNASNGWMCIIRVYTPSWRAVPRPLAGNLRELLRSSNEEDGESLPTRNHQRSSGAALAP
jgi:hypothetical protein